MKIAVDRADTRRPDVDLPSPERRGDASAPASWAASPHGSGRGTANGNAVPANEIGPLAERSGTHGVKAAGPEGGEREQPLDLRPVTGSDPLLGPDAVATAAHGRRLKVLISAYSCSPGSGSERGIGWNTAREMARRHDVWVLTRAGGVLDPPQRDTIETELDRDPVPGLHFLYYDLPHWIRRLFGVQVSSYLWQLAAARVAQRAHEEIGFDLAHHVSWVRYYTPSVLARTPIPFVWGPIGGADTMPRSFRRGLSLPARLEELQRRLLGALAAFDPLVRATARRSTITLANSEETAERVAGLGARPIRIFGESGVDSWVLGEAVASDPPPRSERVHFASMTRLLHWKGVHLGLEAFARLDAPNAVYWVVGDGPEAPRLRGLARELGIEDRVEFLPDLTRAEWMDRLRRCDALVHPCIYNSGSAISLEAMAFGRPVICLDRGGIRHQVTSDVGFRVKAANPDEAIAGVIEAMKTVVYERDVAEAKGRLARERVQRQFSWEARVTEFDRVYAYALAAASASPAREPGAEQRRSIAPKEI